MKHVYKIVLLTIVIFTIVGCGTKDKETIDSSPLSDEFKTDAVELVKVIDAKMSDGKPLSSEEKHKFDLFLAKREQMNIKEERSILNDLMTLRSSHIIALGAEDPKLKRSSYADYTKYHEKLKKELNIQ